MQIDVMAKQRKFGRNQFDAGCPCDFYNCHMNYHPDMQ